MTVSAAAVWMALTSGVGCIGAVGPQAYRRLARATSEKTFLIIGSPLYLKSKLVVIQPLLGGIRTCQRIDRHLPSSSSNRPIRRLSWAFLYRSRFQQFRPDQQTFYHFFVYHPFPFASPVIGCKEKPSSQAQVPVFCILHLFEIQDVIFYHCTVWVSDVCNKCRIHADWPSRVARTASGVAVDKPGIAAGCVPIPRVARGVVAGAAGEPPIANVGMRVLQVWGLLLGVA